MPVAQNAEVTQKIPSSELSIHKVRIIAVAIKTHICWSPLCLCLSVCLSVCLIMIDWLTEHTVYTRWPYKQVCLTNWNGTTHKNIELYLLNILRHQVQYCLNLLGALFSYFTVSWCSRMWEEHIGNTVFSLISAPGRLITGMRGH